MSHDALLTNASLPPPPRPAHATPMQGVTTAVAMQEGLASPLFALGICFSVIVMYDAAGVRRHAGTCLSCMTQQVCGGMRVRGCHV